MNAAPLRLSALALAGVLSLSACSAARDLFGVNPEQPIGIEPAPILVDPPQDAGPTVFDGQGQGAQLVTTNPGATVDARARQFDTFTSDNETSVTLFFYSGVEPCNILDDVVVVEDDTSVTLTLMEGSGRAANGEQVACIEIAVYKAVNVTLAAPLGDRELIDGAV